MRLTVGLPCSSLWLFIRFCIGYSIPTSRVKLFHTWDSRQSAHYSPCRNYLQVVSSQYRIHHTGPRVRFLSDQFLVLVRLFNFGELALKLFTDVNFTDYTFLHDIPLQKNASSLRQGRTYVTYSKGEPYLMQIGLF